MKAAILEEYCQPLAIKTESYPLDAVHQVHARVRANQVRGRAVLTPD